MQTENANKTLKSGIYTGAAMGLLLPFLAWVLDFIITGRDFTGEQILLMHKQSPILFVLYLAPIIGAIIIYSALKKNTHKEAEYEKRIAQKEEIINKNAVFAKQIGEGDYKSQIEFDQDDLIGQSLLRMRDNLLKNFEKEGQQNWISKGKDLISNILRIHNNLDDLSYDVIVNIIKYIDAIQGAFYVYDEESKSLINLATYAYNRKKFVSQEFKIGQGLIGQCAYEMDVIYMTHLPDDYITITSGILGDKKPGAVFISPLITDEKLQGVIEVATIDDEISELSRQFITELSDIIARTVFNLNVNKRTEKLLYESQKMTEELKEREEQLNQNAEEMRATQEELRRSNDQLEQKMEEVQNAQKRLHSLLENASEVISIYDANKTTKYESPSVEKILGYKADEVIGQKGFTSLDENARERIDEMFNKLVESPNEAQKVEFRYQRKDGEEMWLESLGKNLLKDPAISGIILNTRDITQNKIAEKEQRMRGKMQALSENSPDMIIRLGIDYHIFYVNPMVEQFTGVNKDLFAKHNMSEMEIHESIKNFLIDVVEQVKSSLDKVNTEAAFETPQGERIMTVNAIPEYTEEKELETVLIVAHDITEAKLIEREIQEKNFKITESINYAHRIQTAILPDNKSIKEDLPESFIFYRPRDVVSGDFPWFFKKEDIIYISAVDCTGHGVPGALLSFIGYFILNNVVDKQVGYTSGKILDEMHAGVRRTLRQDSPDAEARDGMDIAFCVINKKTNKLQYSGAHRPLYLLRNEELIEYKGNRKAIGGIPLGKKKEKDFITHEIDILKGDKIFFFSDGLPDQVGGEKGRKYSPKRIREAITDNKDFTMNQYHAYFSKDLKQYKGEKNQVDDILLIGIEF